MRLIVIDISGSMPSDYVEQIRRDIRVGDTVLSFDTRLSNIRTMQSAADIAKYPLHGSGGTLWEPVRDYIAEAVKRHGKVEARVYSDMYFANSPADAIEGADITFIVPKGADGLSSMNRERGLKVIVAA